MSDLNLTKFGKMNHADNNCIVSETPVSRLSRILSQASFTESKGSLSHTGLNVRSVANWLPADIDESANQEAPTTTNADWLLGFPFTDTQETSHSFSSGYYSSSITRSAPQLLSGSISSNSHIHASGSSSLKRSSHVEKNSVPQSVSALERRHSFGPRQWLRKQESARHWPRISGISRKFSINGMDSSFDETNSCPAAIFHSNSEDVNTSVVKLPLPTHEIPSEKADENTSVSSGCSSTGSQIPESQNTSVTEKISPVVKRRRIESPKSPDQLLMFANQPHSLDDTIPIEVGNAASLPADSEDKSLEFLRLHSTPTLSKRPLIVKGVTPLVYPKIHSFSYETKQAEAKLGFSRCISVPMQTLETSLPMPKAENHHSSSMVCDDSWASVLRPRALPVIDRTASGLHCVSTDVIAELVRDNGRKRNRYTSYRNVQHVIIDCRFPYEYEGGHIKGAINIFTHSDLVQEIFNRVPAQRPPGAPGPPKLLGDGLARRLAATMKEPLSAPCELASPESETGDCVDEYEEEESWISEEVEQDHFERGANSSSTSSTCSSGAGGSHTASESDRSSGGSRKSGCSGASNSTVDLNGSSGHEHSSFVVIFHCEFSSQRAPDLAAFLRNVDRLSNYHRYPFLYFPEIYIMKGGYSAFYRKYPRLCCPKQYVKMFHRDYREHLRLYRRLTKRVSSACLACIRPQNRILVSGGTPPPETGGRDIGGCAMAEPIFGLDFSGNSTFAVRPPLLPSPCSTEKKTICTNGPLFRSRHQASVGRVCSVLDCEADKENISIWPSDDTFELKSTLSEGDNALHDSDGNLQLFIQSSAGHRLSSASPLHEKITPGSDSPLSVAEAVVRAGHRVMAATLTSAVPSAEVVEALDIFHRRATLPIPIELKRANTVMGMFRETARGAGGRKRPPSISGLDLLPLSSLENRETPMAGRLKRANTVGCHLSLEMMQKEANDALTAVTPILNFTRRSKNSMDSPTVDYGMCGKESP